MVFCSKQRARAPEDKEQRRADLLAAAKKLFSKNGGALPSVAQVAKAAGVSKGTLYLYFRTKEEIFLALFEESLAHWLAGIRNVAMHGGREGILERVLEAVWSYLEKDPDFLRVAVLTSSVLERNIDPARALAHKRAVAVELASTFQELRRAFPELAPAEAAGLLTRSYGTIIGLWQMAEPPPVIRELMVKHADLAPFRIGFEKETKRALRALWQDALSGQSREGPGRYQR